MSEKYGLEVVVPNETDKKVVHDITYRELCVGDINDSSQQEYLRIVNGLAESGAGAVVLGCTEIGMLIAQEHKSASLCDYAIQRRYMLKKWLNGQSELLIIL